jgi:uncharacterized membrane protein YedE/YeeE
MRLLAALAAGLLFGAGLSLSRMIDPVVVLAFLDFAAVPDGRWNPALAFVMASALLVVATGYALIFRRRAPLLAPAYAIPSKRSIDGRLIAGAMTFGLGWGLVGYCPGPAIAGLGFGLAKTWLFVGAMLMGMALHHVLIERRSAHRAERGSRTNRQRRRRPLAWLSKREAIVEGGNASLRGEIWKWVRMSAQSIAFSASSSARC